MKSAAADHQQATTVEWGHAPTRFGEAYITWEGENIVTLGFGNPDQPMIKPTQKKASPRWHPVVLTQNNARAAKQLPTIIEQLKEPPILLHGSQFQLDVWAALRLIPRGETRSYAEIADEINCASPRAVGQAIGANPIALIVPCHQVIRNNGGLGGYHWGLDIKQQILDWESAQTRTNP